MLKRALGAAFLVASSLVWATEDDPIKVACAPIVESEAARVQLITEFFGKIVSCSMADNAKVQVLVAAELGKWQKEFDEDPATWGEIDRRCDTGFRMLRKLTPTLMAALILRKCE